MNRVTRQAAQGDVLIRKVDELPVRVTKVKSNGKLVIAHSETGHDHVVQDPNVVMYELPDNPLVCYLVAANPFEVIHQRAFDTHAPLLLDGGGEAVWEVRRQREYIPEGWRRVED